MSDRLLDATDDLKYKAMFAIMYSSVMRVSEVIHLHYNDISRTNMQIHVRDIKYRMDRYTILSKRNLDLLTEYWFQKECPKEILFPNKFTGGYLTVSTLEQVMRRSVVGAGLPKQSLPTVYGTVLHPTFWRPAWSSVVFRHCQGTMTLNPRKFISMSAIRHQ